MALSGSKPQVCYCCFLCEILTLCILIDCTLNDPQKYLLIFLSYCFLSSVDLVLPCVVCITLDNGKEPEKWREAVMQENHLRTKMTTRLRQHMSRSHKLNDLLEDSDLMRNFAKDLLCPFLHTRQRAESSSEVLCGDC